MNQQLVDCLYPAVGFLRFAPSVPQKGPHWCELPVLSASPTSLTQV